MVLFVEYFSPYGRKILYQREEIRSVHVLRMFFFTLLGEKEHTNVER
jgi:hypothetical protein